MLSAAPPPDVVLDLFAVPGAVEAVPGSRGASVTAGDLVLSPHRDAATAAWLNPVLARLAVRLDEQPGRRPRDLRVAMPVPARDGSWVVDGWGASRFEAGTKACSDLEVTLAAGRLLHAELDSVVRQRPAELDAPDETDLGPSQLVHAALAGSVLLDPLGAPVVIDFVPAWRPVLWAEALCVLDAVMDLDAPIDLVAAWTGGREREAMLQAVAHRAAGRADDEFYAPVLALIDPPTGPR